MYQRIENFTYLETLRRTNYFILIFFNLIFKKFFEILYIIKCIKYTFLLAYK